MVDTRHDDIRRLAGFAETVTSADLATRHPAGANFGDNLKMMPQRLADLKSSMDDAKASARKDAQALLGEMRKLNRTLVSMNNGYDPNKSALSRWPSAVAARLERRVLDGSAATPGVKPSERSKAKSVGSEATAAILQRASDTVKVFTHDLRLNRQQGLQIQKASTALSQQITNWALRQATLSVMQIANTRGPTMGSRISPTSGQLRLGSGVASSGGFAGRYNGGGRSGGGWMPSDTSGGQTIDMQRQRDGSYAQGGGVGWMDIAGGILGAGAVSRVGGAMVRGVGGAARMGFGALRSGAGLAAQGLRAAPSALRAGGTALRLGGIAARGLGGLLSGPAGWAALAAPGLYGGVQGYRNSNKSGLGLLGDTLGGAADMYNPFSSSPANAAGASAATPAAAGDSVAVDVSPKSAELLGDTIARKIGQYLNGAQGQLDKMSSTPSSSDTLTSNPTVKAIGNAVKDAVKPSYNDPAAAKSTHNLVAETADNARKGLNFIDQWQKTGVMPPLSSLGGSSDAGAGMRGGLPAAQGGANPSGGDYTMMRRRGASGSSDPGIASGGGGGGSAGKASDAGNTAGGGFNRAADAAEVEGSAETKMKMFALTMAETGGTNDKSNRALMETIYNRKQAQGKKSLDETMGANYYEPMQGNAAAYNKALARMRSDPEAYKRMERLHKEVVAGSNDSKFGTHNSSAGVADSARRTQSVTAEEGGETFSRKDREEHAGLHGAGTTAKEKAWYEATKAAREKSIAENGGGVPNTATVDVRKASGSAVGAAKAEKENDDYLKGVAIGGAAGEGGSGAIMRRNGEDPIGSMNVKTKAMFATAIQEYNDYAKENGLPSASITSGARFPFEGMPGGFKNKNRSNHAGGMAADISFTGGLDNSGPGVEKFAEFAKKQGLKWGREIYGGHESHHWQSYEGKSNPFEHQYNADGSPKDPNRIKYADPSDPNGPYEVPKDATYKELMQERGLAGRFKRDQQDRPVATRGMMNFRGGSTASATSATSASPGDVGKWALGGGLMASQAADADPAKVSERMYGINDRMSARGLNRGFGGETSPVTPTSDPVGGGSASAADATTSTLGANGPSVIDAPAKDTTPAAPSAQQQESRNEQPDLSRIAGRNDADYLMAVSASTLV